jgi:hypothetical protein
MTIMWHRDCEIEKRAGAGNKLSSQLTACIPWMAHLVSHIFYCFIVGGVAGSVSNGSSAAWLALSAMDCFSNGGVDAMHR